MTRIASDIIHTVSAIFDVPVDDMKSKSRAMDLARARFAAAYILRSERKLSYPIIGRLLGRRDHSTIMHACVRAAELNLSDPEFADMLSRASA